MKILFLTQWFEPEPTFKGLAFARELVRRGHEVEVLTGFPNYPGGRVYPGYRIRLRQREVVDGIPVTRVALYPSHDRSAVRRVVNYLSFALSAATIGACSVGRADVVYVYHPPATIAFPAMVLRLLRRVPFVLDIMDLWPDTLAATGMVGNWAVLGAMGWFCRLAYRCTARIAVVSPGFKQTLIDRGVPAEKIEVIYNWCNEAALSPRPLDEALAQELGLAGRFNVVFAGNMGKAQGLETVLKAAAWLAKEAPKVQFVLVGGGTEVGRLRGLAAELCLGNVRFVSRRPPSEIAAILSIADALLVHLRDDPLFAITIPSKTQTYLAVGRPIVMAVRGDAAELVQRAGAGVACPPESPEALGDAVERLYRMTAVEREAMGRRGRDFYMSELSMAAGTARFESLFEKIAPMPRKSHFES
jgi:colanic acid biosynthesis glycosyl transferase WcaI